MTLFADLPRTHDAVAVGATVIDQVSPPPMSVSPRRIPRSRRAILSMMARRLHMLLEFADDLRRLPLKVQLAKLLASMAQAAESSADATHEDLAAILGVSRVAIGTALRALEREGLAKRRYGRVEVPDRAALRRQPFPLQGAQGGADRDARHAEDRRQILMRASALDSAACAIDASSLASCTLSGSGEDHRRIQQHVQRGHHAQRSLGERGIRLGETLIGGGADLIDHLCPHRHRIMRAWQIGRNSVISPKPWPGRGSR